MITAMKAMHISISMADDTRDKRRRKEQQSRKATTAQRKQWLEFLAVNNCIKHKQIKLSTLKTQSG